jgi:hypothetical protein
MFTSTRAKCKHRIHRICSLMSCLNTFCISHFEENEEFIRVTKKELLLDKANFAIDEFEVDE